MGGGKGRVLVGEVGDWWERGWLGFVVGDWWVRYGIGGKGCG